MKKLRILLTAGGTGGHIYPILAIAGQLRILAVPKGIDLELRYFGAPGPYQDILESNGIKVSKILSSKLRRYFSLKNFLDAPKFVFSFFQALFKIFWFMPEAVFSKGGPGALAVVMASRFYRLPIVIHESDAVPGLTNRLSARSAKIIFTAFKKAAQYFPPEKIILVGNPIRTNILENIPDRESAKKAFGFNPTEPVILVIGGSQGALRINNFIADNLGEILDSVQVIHQAGPANFPEVKKETDFLLRSLGDFYKNRYYLVGYLEEIKDLRAAFAAADLVLSRAGSGAIFEIAAFSKPAILIPLEEAAGDHQRMNAYEYAETGAAIVIEENNLKPGIFLLQVQKILAEPELKAKMSQAAKNFSKPEAAKIIAEEILKLAS